MKTLFTIEGCDVIEQDDGSISYTAKAAIDGDGDGSSHGDPDFQPDTTLHYDGEPLNADIDRYIVVPPQIREAVTGIVLGCMAHVVNTRNGRETDAVVGDIGPHHKLGEISIATAEALGIPPSPTEGGEDDHVIFYQLWPGEPADVNGKQYSLTAAMG